MNWPDSGSPCGGVAALSCTPQAHNALARATSSHSSSCSAAWSMLKLLCTCAGVSTSGAPAFAEALRVVANHMGEQSRQQAQLAALVQG